MFTHADLRLRKLNEDDLQSLVWLKEESWFGTHRATIVNLYDQKRWFASLDSHPHTPRDLYMVAEARSNDLWVGIGIFKINGVDYMNRTADVGWDVFKRFRGLGYGKRIVAAGSKFCFDILNLNRLTAEILQSNIASLKCALPVGFSQEGRKRQAVLRAGKYEDSIVYGLLASEFKEYVVEPQNLDGSSA